MTRRTFLQSGLAAACLTTPVVAALKQNMLDEAAAVLSRATGEGLIAAAVLHVVQREAVFTRTFGKANADSMFLLGSISKPIAVTALMTLFERGLFRLDDPVKKYLPAFTGDGREAVTMQHLLTHVSGLPDQLPENNALRRGHASLAEFAEHATKTPLHFAPGSQYQYSSMAILLATRVAELLGGADILKLVESKVFEPLGMKRSAQGLGRFKLEDMVPVQTEHAAPESGAGDPTAKEWDWNSTYWRSLGAPWGGAHSSAPDLARFLGDFLNETGITVKPETARLMVTNHNAPGLMPRGLGLGVGPSGGSLGCSDKCFGHTGSTGTIAWADPTTHTICVVLTSLPARAVEHHPRDLAAVAVAGAAEGK